MLPINGLPLHIYILSLPPFSVLTSLLSSSTTSLLRFSSIFTATLFIHPHYYAFHPPPLYAFHPPSLSTLKMHFSTFLIAATALYAVSASGKCFQHGQNWGDHPAAKAQLAEACKELKGKYTPRELRGRCRKNPSRQVSYIFVVENYTGEDAQISQDECERNIGAQIDNCGHGGEITTPGMRYRYVLYNRSWSTRLLLLTQIGAIRRMEADGAYGSLLNRGGRVGRG